MDDFSRAVRAAEERGYQRGFLAGQNEAYNRGWREGVAVARGELERLTDQVQQLLRTMGLDRRPGPRRPGESAPPLQ